MTRRASSSDSGSRGGGPEKVDNIRTKPPHIYDNITRRLLQLGITLAITTFVGLIVRYAVQEFDPSVNTITVTTSRINNRDVASLSVSKNFLERILEFVQESISIVATIIPIGFPLCTIFNKHFAKMRAGSKRFELKDARILSMIPKYVVIGDTQACQMANSSRLRPLVRDTIYHLIKAQLKPKLIVEDSFDEARRLGIRIGLIRHDHHKLAVIKSVDLLKNITDSRGDIKQGKVRYLLSRMKIMSQATPADKSLLIYLMKHCESMPNENLAYVGYSFTDPEAMKLADCAMTFDDCDDDDVKKAAQLIFKADDGSFTDIYLFIIVCLITSNITQAYALYQISASVSCCIYRFLSITVFQEQLISHSQFSLLIIIQQLFAIFALMTKWLSSLPQAPLRNIPPGAELLPVAAQHQQSSSVIDIDSTPPYVITSDHSTTNNSKQHHSKHLKHHRSTTSVSVANGLDTATSQMSLRDPDNVLAASIPMQSLLANGTRQRDDTLYSSSSSLDDHNNANDAESTLGEDENDYLDRGDASAEFGGSPSKRSNRKQRHTNKMQRDLAHQGVSTNYHADRHSTSPNKRRPSTSSAHYKSHRHKREQQMQQQPIHLSGTDLDLAVINSKLATSYRQTFKNSSLIDDITYRLAKLHIVYQVLVMIIIMIFGNAMFQLNMSNNRQHQTLALNSLIMNNILTLASCFNQFGAFDLRSGFRNHPFFVCVLLFAVGLQVCLTELNAFGLENLNPLQWFVCFVFALLSSLIAPLTGQQRRRRPDPAAGGAISGQHRIKQHQQQQQQQQQYLKHPAAALIRTQHRPSRPSSARNGAVARHSRAGPLDNDINNDEEDDNYD